MSRRVEHLDQRIEGLKTRIAELASDPNVGVDTASELLRELEEAESARRRTLMEMVQLGAAGDGTEGNASARDGRVAKSATIPVRERVLAGLELVGVPARGSLVSAAASARTGLEVEARQLSSLRRSELASWRAAPDRRPAYVVPALHFRRFEPLRGVVASSAWEPWRRIVGPLSPRADHLRATVRVAQNVEWARERSPEIASHFERLLWLLARSVPGQGDVTQFDIEKVAQAADAELALLEDEDRSERESAAERLLNLPPQQQLFGAGLQVVSEENA